MRQGSEGPVGRLGGRRVLASVAVCVVALVPAVAAGAGSRPQAEAWGPPKGMTAEQVRPAVDQMRDREAAFVVRRNSAAERARRKASRTSHAGASKSAAIGLARGRGMAEPAFRVPGRDDGTKVSRFLSDNAVAVDGPNGPAVAVSSTPLRTEDGKPLNLDLRDRGSVFVPANALSDISISKSASGGASVAGVTVTPVGATGAQAVLVGNRGWYYDVARATDYTVAVLPNAIETYWTLRGAAAPEDHVLKVSVPEGTRLVAGADDSTVAKVVDGDGKTLVTIGAASTLDADGVAVKTITSVVGDELRVHVAHRTADVLYPAITDPLVSQPYGTGAYSSSGTWAGWDRYDWNCGSINTNYASIGVYFNWIMGSTCEGRWRYTSPGSSYAFEADFSSISHSAPASDPTAKSAVWYGINNASGASAGGYWWNNGGATAVGAQPAMETASYSNQARRVCIVGNPAGNSGLCPDPGGNTGGTVTFFGLYQPPPGQCCYSGDQYSTSPDAILYTSDQGLASAPSTNLPAGWQTAAPASVAISGSTETGLGIESVRLDVPSAGINNRRVSQSCSVVYTSPYRPCPSTISTPINVTLGTLASGTYPVTTRAATPIKDGTPTSQTLKVDHDGPGPVNVTGDGWDPPGGIVLPTTHTVTVNASDAHSGVKSIRFWITGPGVSGQSDADQTQNNTGCTGTNGGCPNSMTANFTFDASQYPGGQYTLHVQANDQLGNVSTAQTRDVQFGGVGLPDADCTTRIKEGYDAGTFVSVRADQTPNGARVCVQVANGSTNKYTVVGIDGGSVAGIDHDEDAQACKTAGGNVPIDVTVAGQYMLFGTYTDSGEAWVCVEVGSVKVRVIANIPGTSDVPTVKVGQDSPPATPPVDWPDGPSATCRASFAPDLVNDEFSGNHLWLAKYQPDSSTIDLCLRLKGAVTVGGMLQVTTAPGSGTWPVYGTAPDSLDPAQSYCQTRLVDGTIVVEQHIGISTGNPAAVCVNGTRYYVGTQGSGVPPVVKWTPDYDSIDRPPR